jgi:hypothetical protein
MVKEASETNDSDLREELKSYAAELLDDTGKILCRMK